MKCTFSKCSRDTGYVFFLRDRREGFVFSWLIYGGNRNQVLRTFFPEDWNAEGAKLPRR